MGGHSLPKIPSYKIYKWENVPELVEVQERLKKHGLKDPWLRNEVWRYHPGMYAPPSVHAWNFFKKGSILGFSLGVLTYYSHQYYIKHIDPGFYHWQNPALAHDDDHHGGEHSDKHEKHH